MLFTFRYVVEGATPTPSEQSTSDSSAQRTKQARMVLEKRSVDFGVVDQDCHVTETIRIRNTGSETLNISVSGPFMCDSAFEYFLPEPDIPPSSHAKMEISFDSDYFYGQINDGLVLYSNDSNSPRSRIELSTEVQPRMVIIPRKCIFRKPAEKIIHRTVVIKNVSPNELRLDKVESNCKAISVTAHPHKRDVILDVYLDGRNLTKEDVEKEIVVHFKGEQPTRRKIPVIIHSH